MGLYKKSYKSVEEGRGDVNKINEQPLWEIPRHTDLIFKPYIKDIIVDIIVRSILIKIFKNIRLRNSESFVSEQQSALVDRLKSNIRIFLCFDKNFNDLVWLKLVFFKCKSKLKIKAMFLFQIAPLLDPTYLICKIIQFNMIHNQFTGIECVYKEFGLHRHVYGGFQIKRMKYFVGTPLNFG